MEHALSCLARLIRILLGPLAVADKKLECGHGLVVLGVRVLSLYTRVCASLGHVQG